MTPAHVRGLVALLGAVVLLVGATAAAEPSLEVRLQPERLGVEDVAFLTVIVREGAPSGVPQLELENLEIVNGPSTERQFNWANGRSSSAFVINWVVRPQGLGTARVGPLEVAVDGTTIRSDAVVVEVVPGSLAPPRRHPMMPRNPLEELLARRAGASARVALHTLVDARQVIQGGTVGVTVVLDTSADVEGFEWVTPPTFPGWWAQTVDLPERPTGEIVEVDGVRYRRFPIARWVLIPLSPGELEVPAARARIGLRSPSAFAPPQVLERATRSHTITVAERPPAPEGFVGAVGQLRYSARLEPAEVRVGEPLVLTVELEGRGNLPLVEAPPQFPEDPAWELYPPEEESAVQAEDGTLHGRRTWRTTVLPRSAGTIELPPVEVAVFDPAAGRYRTTSLGPLRAEVQPPPAAATPAAAEPVAAPERRPAADRVVARPVSWPWVAAALVVGVLLGVGLTLLVAVRTRNRIPAAGRRQSPGERARQLQVVLDEWWRGLPEERRGERLQAEVEALRRDLEGVRFAPARADHTGTVSELESRLRLMLRRA